MPNWCSNRIIIRGHDDHVRKFFLTVAEDDQHVGTLDFMKIIPMPKELGDTEESFNSFAMMAAYLSAINPDAPDWGFEKVSERTYDDLIDKLSKVRPNVGIFEDAPTDFAGNGELVSVFDERSGNINNASGSVIQQIIEDAIYNYKDYDYSAFDTEYGSIWDDYAPYRTGKIKLIHDKYSEAEESA